MSRFHVDQIINMKTGMVVVAMQTIIRLTLVTILLFSLLLRIDLVHARDNILLQEGFWRSATLEEVTAALARGADLEAVGSYNRTPLHFAAEFGTPAAVATLLELGANMEARNVFGMTVLHAAATGRVGVVELLLDRGMAINATDKQEETPLFRAVREENPAVVKKLLERGADAFDRDSTGQTVLHVSALSGTSPVITRLLLEYGLDAYALDNKGETPLDKARRNQHTEGIAALLQRHKPERVLKRNHGPEKQLRKPRN